MANGRPTCVPVAFGAAAERGELVADRRGAGVLPDDRGRDRFSRAAVPHDGGFALVGDADRGDLARIQLGAGECTSDDGAGVGPDLACVVLDPPGPGQVLTMLDLLDRHHPGVVIEEDAAGGCGALIDRGDDR